MELRSGSKLDPHTGHVLSEEDIETHTEIHNLYKEEASPEQRAAIAASIIKEDDLVTTREQLRIRWPTWVLPGGRCIRFGDGLVVDQHWGDRLWILGSYPSMWVTRKYDCRCKMHFMMLLIAGWGGGLGLAALGDFAFG